MYNCTFFGHRHYSGEIKYALESVLVNLIENYKVDLFYIGNHGFFDSAVCHSLISLSKKYPHIKYCVVLAYIPGKLEAIYTDNAINTLLPEGIENVHPRFAISWRNRWMLEHSDYVVTYITRPFGGAFYFAELAKKKGKQVINIADFVI